MHIHYHEQSSSVVFCFFLTSVWYEVYCQNLWSALVSFCGCLPCLCRHTCLHFVSHPVISPLSSPASFHLPLPPPSVIPPIICSKGQAACPCPHAHSGRVQERLCGGAPEIQQGTELFLLHGDTADLQCEANRNAHIHTAPQLQRLLTWADATLFQNRIQCFLKTQAEWTQYEIFVVPNRKCRTWMSGGFGVWQRDTASFQISRRRCCPSSPSV